MPETRRSTTADLPLSQVIQRLTRHPTVDGLIVIGSARAAGELTPTSDYDLVVVLSAMRVPLHVGLTSIDRRVADLVFCTTQQVTQFLSASEPLDFGTWVGRLAGWLEMGDIAFDRNGQ